MDTNTIKYLRKRSGSDNPAAQYQFVLKIADWFKKESQKASIVGRTMVAEVPPELDNFTDNDESDEQGALID